MQIEIDETIGEAMLMGDFDNEANIRDQLQEALDTESMIELIVEDVPFRANVAEVIGHENDSGGWTAKLVNLRRETLE